eukprot:2169746-Pyramimonas_sp.AAC.1
MRADKGYGWLLNPPPLPPPLTLQALSKSGRVTLCVPGYATDACGAAGPREDTLARREQQPAFANWEGREAP